MRLYASPVAVKSLPHFHRTALTSAVDFFGVFPIGMIPAGRCDIAQVTGGPVAGAPLNGAASSGTTGF